jgi:RNA polymerase sigma factor (sigma-70 family)
MYVRWRRVTSDPNAYARRALVNAANSRWRSRARRAETRLEPEHDRGHPDRTEAVAVQDTVIRALRQLPSKQRAVVVLRYLEDLTEAETAAVLQVSLGTVKSHGSRGLARLREALDTLDLTEGRGR